MGVDYIYAGSTSYSRFDKEITAIAEILGGKLNSEYSQTFKTAVDRESENHNIFNLFGILNVTDKDRRSDKYDFPDELDPIVADWLNHPYKMQSPENTKHIWNVVSKYPCIDDRAHQIWWELEDLVANHRGWYVC